MRICLVSEHYPAEHGSAPDRALFAIGQGLVDEGHELEAWSWKDSPPDLAPPPWCRWEPLPPEPVMRTRARAILRPRSDVVRAGWRPPPAADVVVADDVVSFAAVAAAERAVLTVHYSAVLDGLALRSVSPARLQDVRAERRAARAAALCTAYSVRVAAALPRPTVEVPVAYPVPAEPLEPVAEPTAGLLAGWHWPANRWALRRLLAAWPAVRRRLPRARLVLAGPGLRVDEVGEVPGVEVRGRLRRSADLLSELAVVAFPCPPTSGPKIKVLEALAHGIPVVTTPAGLEGLVPDAARGASVCTDVAEFAQALISLLSDPEAGLQMGVAGRAAVLAAHSPRAAARARVSAYRSAFGL
ncbi:MAG TPA: glycosyltransferase family 4 protein [Acidimicrobiales bacterium]|nr:glycosyltransferase family 4 protein [Acidimicrobiales bacterium]